MATIFSKLKQMGLLKNRGGKHKERRGQDLAKSFREGQRNEEAFKHIDRGTQSVALDQIVGSVGRYHDFDSRFQPKHNLTSDRMDRVLDDMRRGRAMQPVKLYKIKDEYYVLDGNHRVSAAKRLHRQDIAADVIEFLPSRHTFENILYLEKMDFEEKTGLRRAPQLTEPGQYRHLLGQISGHMAYLNETAAASPVSLQQAATDWHTTIYRPLCTIIERGKLIRAFPSRSIADLYAYIHTSSGSAGITGDTGSASAARFREIWKNSEKRCQPWMSANTPKC